MTMLFVCTDDAAAKVHIVWVVYPPRNSEEFLKNMEIAENLHPLHKNLYVASRFHMTVVRPYSGYALTETIRSVPQLEGIVAHDFLKVPKLFNIICWTCQRQDGFLRTIVEDNSMRNWNGEMDMENIYIDIMFPNSSISYGIDFATKFAFPQFLAQRSALADTLMPHSRKSGHYFVTCSDIMEVGRLSILGYTSAYDPTWACIALTSMVTSVALLHFLQRGGFGDYIINAFSVLLEQGCSVSITRKTRWISGVWLLVGIVLSNLYKGDNITSLTAPLPKSKLERFDQLIAANFSYYMNLNAKIVADIYAGSKLVLSLLGLVQSMIPTVFNEVPEFATEDICDKQLLNLIEGNGKPKVQSKLDAIFDGLVCPPHYEDARENFSNPDYFLPILANCGKTAFVGPKADVMKMFRKLANALLGSERRQQISLSKDFLNSFSTYWAFMRVPVPASQLHIRIHSLWHSGIIQEWEAIAAFSPGIRTELEAALIFDERRKPKKLSLNGNLIFVFYMYGLLSLLANILICQEVRGFVYTIVRRNFIKVKNKFRRYHLSLNCNVYKLVSLFPKTLSDMQHIYKWQYVGGSLDATKCTRDHT